MTKNNWRDLYDDAILERNVAVLKVRLQAAEDAIKTRALNSRVSQEERREMGKALFIYTQTEKSGLARQAAVLSIKCLLRSRMRF